MYRPIGCVVKFSWPGSDPIEKGPKREGPGDENIDVYKGCKDYLSVVEIHYRFRPWSQI